MQRLSEWVAVQSVSAWPEKRGEIKKMMEMAAKDIERLGGTVELVDIGKEKVGFPIVLCELVLHTRLWEDYYIIGSRKTSTDRTFVSCDQSSRLQCSYSSYLLCLLEFKLSVVCRGFDTLLIFCFVSWFVVGLASKWWGDPSSSHNPGQARLRPGQEDRVHLRTSGCPACSSRGWLGLWALHFGGERRYVQSRVDDLKWTMKFN